MVNTIQYTDDGLQNCPLGTYIILLTSVTPINSIKKNVATFLILTRGYVSMDFREGQGWGEREREREGNIDGLTPVCALIGD